MIKREKHTVAIDIWALGLIYFKMRIGKPAFPGQSEVELERKILERAIKWPSEYLKPDHADFDDDEKDLVDKLCQLEPKDRLGGTKETMPDLKAHPAFKDIDWVAISSPEFVGARELMDELIQYESDFDANGRTPLVVPKPQRLLPGPDDQSKQPDVAADKARNDLRIVQQGYLNKRNWLGNEQLRYFELYSSGQIKYYELKKDTRKYKDSAWLDEKTEVQMLGNAIKFTSAKKNR